MEPERVNEIRRLIGSCQKTDNDELEAENATGVWKLRLKDAPEHTSMTEEEIDGLLKFYHEANESLMECKAPAGIANRSRGLTEGI